MLDLILHLDKYLLFIANTYHTYIYIIMFLVIFCETGLVVTPFLPGDSLLFIAGSIAATGSLNLILLALTICIAAFCGDNCNFFIGNVVGEKLFNKPNSKIFRQDILTKTHAFYEKHGPLTVIIARFIPLVRTFAPFVAGLGHMTYTKFISFSFVGSVLWVIIFLGGGYMFGNVPIIRSNLSVLILIVMILSVLPVIKMIYGELKSRRS